MFIKLHQDSDGQVVLLNIDQIRAVKPATNKDNDVVSRIVFEDGEELLVKESLPYLDTEEAWKYSVLANIEQVFANRTGRTATEWERLRGWLNTS